MIREVTRDDIPVCVDMDDLMVGYLGRYWRTVCLKDLH
jgi:hypothetical protein